MASGGAGSAGGAGGGSAIHRKIAIIGFRGVGKSSIVQQFVEKTFSEDYEPTLLNTHNVTFRVGGVTFDLEVLETAGQDEHTPVPQAATVGVHGFVLSYSVASRSSFEQLQLVHEALLDTIGVDSIPRVLVGNKSDLEATRQVPTAEGAALAQKWKVPFVETSARLNDHVSEAFEVLIREIEKGSGLLDKPEESRCTLL